MASKELSDFEKEFVAARDRGVSTFTYKGKQYTTKRKDRPNEKLTVKDYGDESERMAARTAAPAKVKNASTFDPREVEEGLEPVRPEEFLGGPLGNAAKSKRQERYFP